MWKCWNTSSRVVHRPHTRQENRSPGWKSDTIHPVCTSGSILLVCGGWDRGDSSVDSCRGPWPGPTLEGGKLCLIFHRFDVWRLLSRRLLRFNWERLTVVTWQHLFFFDASQHFTSSFAWCCLLSFECFVCWGLIDRCVNTSTDLVREGGSEGVLRAVCDLGIN